MSFCKKSICFYSIILCAACHPEGSVNFAGSEYWMLQPGETDRPLDNAIFSSYEKHQLLPSSKAPLSKYIHADRYQVFISLLSDYSAHKLDQLMQTADFTEYRILEKDSVLLSHQKDRQLMYRYLLRKPDDTYLYSVAYDTKKLNFSILIHVVIKDSSHAYQYFQNPDFITQRLGNAGLIVND